MRGDVGVKIVREPFPEWPRGVLFKIANQVANGVGVCEWGDGSAIGFRQLQAITTVCVGLEQLYAAGSARMMNSGKVYLTVRTDDICRGMATDKTLITDREFKF